MKIQDYVTKANSHELCAEFEEFKRDIFKHTLVWEGGNKLHKVSGDSGGWTLYGIAYNHNKQIFDNFDDFKDTTYEEAAAVAYIKYYLTAGADLVPNSSALMYFDIAYNMGVTRAVKIAQKCIGTTADGLLGPITKGKLHMLDEECLYEERVKFYNQLVRRNNTFKKFIKGWLNRTVAIFKID